MSEKENEFTFDKDFSDYFTQGEYKAPIYRESSTVRAANDALNKQLAQKPGAYQSQWQTQLNDTMGRIMNRDKFSYDVNGDALYQQYKDKYIQQGKMAMQDTMGQAAAMTGGYGNSYAASVGNQAYQASLQQLNDVIPELYQMAYDRYAQEGQDLLNQYGLLSDRENTDYGRYRDKVSDFNTERDYLAGRYDSERSFDYSKYTDKRDFDYSKYTNDRNFAYGQYSDDKNLAYTEYQNQIANQQWKDEYQLALDKFEFDKEQASKVATTGGGGNGGNNGGNTPTLDAKDYNDVLMNAATYAEQGKNALKTYLNGLVSRGLSQDEAADIYEQYFPNSPPKADNTTHKLTLMEQRMAKMK